MAEEFLNHKTDLVVESNYAQKKDLAPEKASSTELFSPAERIGELLKAEFEKDPHFYFFSPDETTSNRFGVIFDTEKRAWALEQKEWDLPEDKSGRIVEMLSENVLFSTMTGHLANGEQAMMGSYEAFFSVITSQLLQQIKFIQQSKKVAWRKPLPAVNLLSTSTCWRQDHNGFTHQSPALISTLLAVPSNLVNCLFPADDVSAEEVFHWMLKSQNVVNLTTFNKNPEPRFLTKETVRRQLIEQGAMIFDEVSDRETPDFILTAAGDIPTREALAAMRILREDLPDIKLRFVGITALSYQAIGTTENKLSRQRFNELFLEDRPILANFHGFPETLKSILENYTDSRRLKVHGFNEEGSTTTPFEMLNKNYASRYHLAIDIALAKQRQDLAQKYQSILEQNHLHAVQYGKDLIK